MKQKTKILIAEDEALTAMTMQDVFKKWGYDVCELVATGEEAVEIAQKELPDLVFMDIRLLGKIDGIEAARQIRSFSKASIIFMTGYIEQEVRERAEKLEPTAYLLKPVMMHKLKSIIDSALNKI